MEVQLILYDACLYLVMLCAFGQFPEIVSIFRLHRMHEMQTIVTNVCGVCPSVTRATQQHVQCVHGHSMQPLPNHFGLLIVFQILLCQIGATVLCRHFCAVKSDLVAVLSW